MTISTRRIATAAAADLCRQFQLSVIVILLAVAVQLTPLHGLSAAETQGDNFDPKTGYRIKHYRAALPDAVPGGQRVNTEEVEKIFQARSAIFIDVMPSTGAGFDPKSGQWRLTKTRDNIPGSVWLPDVGHGTLEPTLDRYFIENLTSLTSGDKSKPLLFYCQSDCWMAWNAVKRASSLGYPNLYWYPEGTDGWGDWDNPVEPAKPVPVEIESR